MTQDTVRVLRLLEYVGPREWVEHTLKNSIHGTKEIPSKLGPAVIRAVTLNEFPEIVPPPVPGQPR